MKFKNLIPFIALVVLTLIIASGYTAFKNNQKGWDNLRHSAHR